MANYSVDIALAVKGSEKAAREIKKLEKAINDIQRKAAVDLGGQVRLQGEQRLLREKIKNFQISRKELKNSQEIARLTNERIKGLSQYASTIGPQVDRIAQLQKRAAQEQIQAQQRYNKLVDETLAKLSRIAEVNRKASQYPSPIGPSRGGVTQYPGPIGPEAASQANVPQGPFNRLVDRPRRRVGRGGRGFGGFQSAALGAGFPLLFGGGAASIAGGLLGSAGGFGGQILGSALGQQIDQFAKKAGDLSKALDGLGGSTQALEALIGSLDTATARRIQNLEQSGQVAKAANESFKELSDTIGRENALALDRFGNSANQLGKEFTKLTTIFAAVSIRIGELIKDLVILRDIPGVVLKGFKPPSDPASGAPEETPALALSRTQARRSLQMSQLQTAALRAQGTGSLEEAADAEKRLVTQQETNDLKEFDRKVTEGLKDATKDIAEREKIIEDAKRAILQIDQQLLKATKQRAKEVERLAEQARREQEAARKRFEQEQKQQRSQYDSAVIAEAGQVNALLQLKQQLVAVEKGESAALQQRSEDLFDMASNEKTILDIKYTAAAANAKSVEEGKALYRAYLDQVEAVNIRVKLEAKAIAQTQSRIQLEKTFLAIQQQQALSAIRTGIGRQIEDASLRPTGNKAQDEELRLRINQIRRQKDAELELTDAIEKQKAIRDDLYASDETIDAAVAEIGRLEERLALTKELLPQLDAAEQAQLRFNQALEAVQPITDTVVSGLVTAISAVVEGTKTAEEAFADFLKNIGDMLIQTAAQMIAQYIAIGIAKAFAFGGSGGFASNPTGASTNFIGSGLSGFRAIGLAEGGYVTGPTRAVVGEGGEPEYIIPQSKMRESMDRYSRGARGSSVIPAVGGGGASSEGGGVAVAAPIDVRYTVERINDVDYVTAEQFQQGIQQAAQRGAAEGERRTMRSLQNSTAVRRSLAF